MHITISTYHQLIKWIMRSFTLHFEDTTQRKWKVPGRAEFKSGTWELSWEKPQKI